jgi:hypothetical protein
MTVTPDDDAVRYLSAVALSQAYDDAWTEWSEGPDAAFWESAVSDGVVAD